ncbi:MAG: ATP-binding protein [Candidatus Omnitrophota bacterium]
MKYRKRWIVPALLSATKEHPVVVLTGARQVGKSTILLEDPAFQDWKYFTLDDFNLLSMAHQEPEAIWQNQKKVIIDEVQKEPRLLSTIKQAVDRDRTVRFILSGSANLLLMEKSSESLSGRAVYFNLLPMSLAEIEGRPCPNILSDLLAGKFPSVGKATKPVPKPCHLMVEGFMPPILTIKTSQGQLRWWEGYIATYLERDLRQLSRVESLTDYRRVMEAIALRSGQLLNQTEVSRDVGVTQTRVYRYLNLLEVTCLLKKVPAFHLNRTSRLIKHPKYYFIDPALASYLAGYFTPEDLRAARELGGIFEALVLLHLTILSELLLPAGRIFYWRTVAGQEVDFILEQGKSLIAFEVKYSDTPRYDDTKGLRAFVKEFPEATAGVLVHTGEEVKFLGEKIIALPWSFLG